MVVVVKSYFLPNDYCIHISWPTIHHLRLHLHTTALSVVIWTPDYDFSQQDEPRPSVDQLIFEDDIKQASATLKQYKGSRMKTFTTRSQAVDFLQDPELDESFLDLDSSFHDVATSFERLCLQPQSPRATLTASNPKSPSSPGIFASPMLPPPAKSSPAQQRQSQLQPVASGTDDAEPAFPSAKPAMLNTLRRKIESGDYEAVEDTIWSNPRCLVSVCDSAIYLMAGPKYNACHIAARSNKPEIMALLLDTISNFSFLRKLYPREPDSNIQDRVNHLLDSYLNTPDPRQGNTPLHFACKFGYYRVVRVLLTFEGCDLSLRDSRDQTAEEAVCTEFKPPPPPPAQTMADLEEQLRSKLTLDTTDVSIDIGNGEQDTSKVGDVGSSTGHNNNSETCVRQKIKNMFKQQYNLPLYRDQLKKRLILERRRRSRTGSQVDSETSFSDIDDSFILASPAKPKVQQD